MVEIAMVDKIRDRIWRNFSISSYWIIHTMGIGMNSKYFDSELGLWSNAKATYFKPTKQWLTKFMKSSPRS